MEDTQERSKKSKQELITEIVGSKHSNAQPPFKWQKEEPMIPAMVQEAFESELTNYVLVDNWEIIPPKDHWEKIKQYIDNFYALVEENDFDIDYHNLTRLAEVYRETASLTEQSQDKTDKDPGYIYLLRGKENYKIGRSKEPIKRIRSLQLPFETELICTIHTDAYGKLEDFLHKKFFHKRIRGEWFDLDQDDISYIKNLDGNEYE